MDLGDELRIMLVSLRAPRALAVRHAAAPAAAASLRPWPLVALHPRCPRPLAMGIVRAALLPAPRAAL